MDPTRRISVAIEDRHDEYLATVRAEENAQSDAAAARRIFERAKRADTELQRRDTEIERLEAELQQREARIDELRSELAAANRRIDDVGELVATVEREQSLAERRARAGLLRRAKWWLVGMPDDSEA